LCQVSAPEASRAVSLKKSTCASASHMQVVHIIAVFVLVPSAVFAVRPGSTESEDSIDVGELQAHGAKEAANNSRWSGGNCTDFEDTGDPWNYNSAQEAKSTSKATLDKIREELGILPPNASLRYAHMMCTKRDVCLLMKQLDFRSLAEQKFKNKGHNFDATEYWYYSTYKLKESMRAGGTTANSAACSFGMHAELSRKGWTSSACAKLMTYRGQMQLLRKKRALYMEVMSNRWCPQIWEEAIGKGWTCNVTRADRQTKYALTTRACEEIEDEALDEMGEPTEFQWHGFGG